MKKYTPRINELIEQTEAANATIARITEESAGGELNSYIMATAKRLRGRRSIGLKKRLEIARRYHRIFGF